MAGLGGLIWQLETQIRNPMEIRTQGGINRSSDKLTPFLCVIAWRRLRTVETSRKWHTVTGLTLNLVCLYVQKDNKPTQRLIFWKILYWDKGNTRVKQPIWKNQGGPTWEKPKGTHLKTNWYLPKAPMGQFFDPPVTLERVLTWAPIEHFPENQLKRN